jgi:hypothetical protein
MGPGASRRPSRPPPPQRASSLFWTDLRLRLRADDRSAADLAVERLVEAAEDLGFDLELAKTRHYPPAEPLPD